MKQTTLMIDYVPTQEPGLADDVDAAIDGTIPRIREANVREEISYNSRYLMKDKKPWSPVMGELHYSRYNADLWEESLHKRKAGS